MGGAGAYTLDLVDIFIATLLLFLIRDLVTGHRSQIRLSKVTLIWGALIILAMFQMITGPLRNVMAMEIFRMLKLLLLFLVIINEVVRVKQFKHVFAAIIIGLALQCVIGLTQYMLGSPLGAEILGEAAQDAVEYTSKATYRGSEFTYRVGSLFGHPNLLSIYLAMFLPIAIAMLFTNMKPFTKIAVTVVIFAGLVVLVLTLSRSGWISFTIAFVTLLAMSFFHPAARFKFLFGRVAMIAGIGLMAVLLARPILKRLFESDPNAVSFRWEWMQLSWEMILEKPLFGFGLNTYVYRMIPYTEEGTLAGLIERFGSALPVVHNVYLLVWTEQGTVGLLLFLGLNAYLLILSWRSAKCFQDENLYMINLGCFCAVLALASDGMASFFIRNPAPGRVFFMVAGLIVAIYYWNQENRGSFKNGKPTAPVAESGPADSKQTSVKGLG